MITFDEKTKSFFLQGKGCTYAFTVNPYGYAEHLYFGRPIPAEDLTGMRASGTISTVAALPGSDEPQASYQLFPSELTFGGTGDYREPCVVPENPAGDRLTELLYDSHEILPAKPEMRTMPSLSGGETLLLRLADKVTGFRADLYYTVYDDASVVTRRIVYRAGGKKVVLRRAYSFAFTLPGNQYDVLSLYGGWARERQPDRVPLHHGVFCVDSKRTTSSSELNPFLAVMDRAATETQGEVWGMNLVYSSSWQLKAQGTIEGDCLVTGGISDADFSWELNPGEELETPEVVLAFSANGLGGMSRAYHDAYRSHLIQPRFVRTPRPLLINNWEGTYFDFDNEKLKAIVDAVDGTGIDTFVLDDGWFGKRDDDHSGLGDWVVNTSKLRGGLGELIDYVHAKGMRFGLWFEPEMISEDSNLYRAHPDYAISSPDRLPVRSRNQLMLDLTREDVRDCIVKSVNTILDENEIDYVKWDYNRNVTESWSRLLPPERQKEFAHRYALGVYDLFRRIVETHPKIFFEGCAGGGARFDPAVLRYFPQIWTSDDTDAEERTYIQYGTSIVYPLSAMSCHVSICPNHQTGRTTPFATRADVAHLGATGYELDTTTFTDEDREAVRAQVSAYREMQELVLNGDLYRIDSPYEGNFFTEMLVSKDRDRAHVTCYRRMGRVNSETKRIRLQGLDETKRYLVRELGREFSGAALMGFGLVPEYGRGDFETVCYTLESV